MRWAAIATHLLALAVVLLGGLSLAPASFVPAVGAPLCSLSQQAIVSTTQSVGTAGGSFPITGANFVSGASAYVTIAGMKYGPLSTTYTNAGAIVATLPIQSSGYYAIGTTWPVEVVNPSGCTAGPQSIFTVTTDKTPATICSGAGGTLSGQWIYDNATTSGGSILTVPDASGNGYTATASGSVPFTASDSTFNGHASGGPFSGSELLATGAIATGTVGLLVYEVLMYTSATNFSSSFDYSGGHIFTSWINSSGQPVVNNSTTTLTDTSDVITNQCAILITYYTGGSGQTLSIGANNQGDATTTGTFTVASGGAMTLGSNSAGTAPLIGRQAEVGLCTGLSSVSSNNELNLAQYSMATYHCPAAMTFVYATNIDASTANAVQRVNLTNLLRGTTVSIGGATALTPSVLTTGAGLIELNNIPSNAAGAQSEKFIGPAGGSITVASGANFVPVTNDPFAMCGLGLDLWYGGSTLDTVSSGSLVTAYDMSGLQGSGNSPTQATGADQPARTTSDSTYCNSHPSYSYNGSTDFIQTPGSLLTEGANNAWTYSAWAQGASGSSLNQSGVANQLFGILTSKKPIVYDHSFGTSATFGTTLNLLTTYWEEQAIDTSGNMTVNANNTTAATNTTANAPSTAGVAYYGSHSGGAVQGYQCAYLHIESGHGSGNCTDANLQSWAQSTYGVGSTVP